MDIGQAVFCQNQTGNYPRRWSKTGVMIEKGAGPRQYRVRMDGSRRVCLINRKFLRKMTAVADMQDLSPDPIHDQVTPSHTPTVTQHTRGGHARAESQQDRGGHVPAGPLQDRGSHAPAVPLQHRGGHAPVEHAVGMEVPGLQQMSDVPLCPETGRDVQHDEDPGQGQAGMGRRYPVRERKANLKMKDFELYSVKVPKEVGTGRKKERDIKN